MLRPMINAPRKSTRKMPNSHCAMVAEAASMSVKPKTISAPPLIADCARIADAMLQAAGLCQQEIHVLSEMNLTIACSIDKAKRELGYRPLVDLREGMRRSVAWILDNGGEI